jgi:hypothetical protein
MTFRIVGGVVAVGQTSGQGVDPNPSEQTCHNFKPRNYHEISTNITRMIFFDSWVRTLFLLAGSCPSLRVVRPDFYEVREEGRPCRPRWSSNGGVEAREGSTIVGFALEGNVSPLSSRFHSSTSLYVGELGPVVMPLFGQKCGLSVSSGY